MAHDAVSSELYAGGTHSVTDHTLVPHRSTTDAPRVPAEKTTSLGSPQW